MESITRTFYALEALFEASKNKGDKTLVHDYVLEKIRTAFLRPNPEMMIHPSERLRFWSKCDTEELAFLLTEYNRLEYTDEARQVAALLKAKVARG